jgi:hypothetical protein
VKDGLPRKRNAGAKDSDADEADSRRTSAKGEGDCAKATAEVAVMMQLGPTDAGTTSRTTG